MFNQQNWISRFSPKNSILRQLLHRICICLVYQKPCNTFSPNITKNKLGLKFQQQKPKKLGFKQHAQICKKQNKNASKRKKNKNKTYMMVSLRSHSIVFKQMITHLIGTSYEVWQWYRLKVCHTWWTQFFCNIRYAISETTTWSENCTWQNPAATWLLLL